ncbi:CAAX amino terminal membrane bound protease [Spiroplasma corruscae]|uniref:CAAX amino terminal membrane bound protease n=1 Tax=Spiroplasma corruscae TaxID=216934 RepID=A0A222EMY5_9MOLU|nr:CPBP family intramembrane glutamic endopeptidase [Spiroplasma corruscae]ASP27877.1 CAAX amino terminal membrane bound protease [Spiroplasma corruscae]
MINNIKYRDRKFLQDDTFRFNFNSLNYKVDGVIFILTSFVIPFLFSLFFRIFLDLKNNSTTQEILVYINLLSIIIGLVIFIIRNPKKILKNSYSMFYFFSILPTVMAVIILSISSPIVNDNNKKVLVSFLSMISQILSEIIIIILAFVLDKKLGSRIVYTFKNEKISLLIWVLIGFLLLYFISSLFFSMLIEDFILKLPPSDNQDNLNSLLGSDSNAIKISYGILLFLLTILVAPICEEICMRESYFVNCSNGYIGIVFSTLNFGYIHYGSTGDFEHFMTYTSAALVLSTFFWFTKGNVTYTWLIHMLNNLIALIITFVLL